MPGEYKILMGLEELRLYDALIKYQFYPTEENKKVLDTLEAKNKVRLLADQALKESQFIDEYNLPLLLFIQSIAESEFFLVGKSKPFQLSWILSCDENDNYMVIRFWEGKFNYECEICGGYGGTEIIETDISQERVLELLKLKTY